MKEVSKLYKSYWWLRQIHLYREPIKLAIPHLSNSPFTSYKTQPQITIRYNSNLCCTGMDYKKGGNLDHNLHLDRRLQIPCSQGWPF